jgi:hypothetical protein
VPDIFDTPARKDRFRQIYRTTQIKSRAWLVPFCPKQQKAAKHDQNAIDGPLKPIPKTTPEFILNHFFPFDAVFQVSTLP